MSLFRQDDDEEVMKPLEDIIDGVDSIGTLIDDSLPRMEEQLSEIHEKLDRLIDNLESKTTSPEYTESQISQRLELLEQRFLAFEQTSSTRLTEFAEQIVLLNQSIESLHQKLDTLEGRSTGD